MMCDHNWVYSNMVLCSYPAQRDRICSRCGLKNRIMDQLPYPNEYDYWVKQFHSKEPKDEPEKT